MQSPNDRLYRRDDSFFYQTNDTKHIQNPSIVNSVEKSTHSNMMVPQSTHKSHASEYSVQESIRKKDPNYKALKQKAESYHSKGYAARKKGDYQIAI